MKTKTTLPTTKKAAVNAMVSYIRGLAQRVPAGQKAAQVAANTATVSRLHKLADNLARTGSIFEAVRKSYPAKTSAYHFIVINGLVKGFRKAAAKTVESNSRVAPKQPIPEKWRRRVLDHLC